MANVEHLRLLEELRARQNTGIARYVPDNDPERDQESFHTSTALYRLALGGNRSGKTVVTAAEVAMWARNCHRWQEVPRGRKLIYVISANYMTIFQGIYRHLNPIGDEKDMRFLEQSWIQKRGPIIAGARVPLPSYIDVYIDPSALSDEERMAAAKDKEAWPTSRIMFVSGEGVEQARKKIQGVPLDLAVVDEEVEGIIDELKVRLMDRGGRLCVSATLVQSQPWLLDLEDRAEQGDKNVFLTRLNTEKNPHLNAITRAELISEMSEEEKQVRIYGKSRRRFGLVFPGFDSSHIVSGDSLRLAPGEIYCSHDAGYRVHAVLWAKVLPDHTIYFFRELYAREQSLVDVCRIVAELEGWKLKQQPGQPYYRRVVPDSTPQQAEIVTRLIDPAQLRSLEDGNVSVAIQMAAYYDTPVIPANNSVQSGIETVRRLLEINPLTGKPYIQVSDELEYFLKEIRSYKLRKDKAGFESHETKSEPLRRNNHLMDDFRYICQHVMYGLGTAAPGDRPRGYTAHNATYGMQDRMERQIRALQAQERNSSCHPILGSEW